MSRNSPWPEGRDGASWISRTVTTDTAWIRALAISPAFDTDGTLFAGGAQGLFRSTDRGEHWEAVNTYPGSDVRSLTLASTWASTPILMVGSTTGIGIYRIPCRKSHQIACSARRMSSSCTRLESVTK